jgi:DNA-binding MarR family transcriptional regulator
MVSAAPKEGPSEGRSRESALHESALRESALRESALRESAIQAELLQTRPFPSIYQEATVALLRTAAVLRRAVSRVIEPAGLSMAQYNVLRILRGACPDGLPTLAIRSRLIEEAPGITRLVEKLDRARLIRRDRSTPDRRQVMCFITDEGLGLLARLDDAVDLAEREMLAGLSAEDTERLIALLDAIRARRAPSRARDAKHSGD